MTLKADEGRARACKANKVNGWTFGTDNDDPRPYTDMRFEFTEVNHLINMLLARLFGSKWRDPARRARLPVIAVFPDFQGSRYCAKAPLQHELRDLHVHGTIVLPSDIASRAHEMMQTLLSEASKTQDLLFDQALFEPLDPTRASQLGPHESALRNWVEYSAKGAAHLYATDYWDQDLYRIYPNPNGLTYGFPRPPRGSPERKVSFELLADRRKQGLIVAPR